MPKTFYITKHVSSWLVTLFLFCVFHLIYPNFLDISVDVFLTAKIVDVRTFPLSLSLGPEIQIAPQGYPI